MKHLKKVRKIWFFKNPFFQKFESFKKITPNERQAYLEVFQTTLKGAKNRRFRAENGGFCGASDLTRTGDLLITSEMHYRLCYTSMGLRPDYYIGNQADCQQLFALRFAQYQKGQDF